MYIYIICYRALVSINRNKRPRKVIFFTIGLYIYDIYIYIYIIYIYIYIYIYYLTKTS